MSEWINCEKCGSSKENNCACPNEECEDFNGCRTCHNYKYTWKLCATCNGSGEGMYDKQRCLNCKGQGQIKEDCECVL